MPELGLQDHYVRYPSCEGARVSLHLDKLATQIATLDPAEQDALWEKVAELNLALPDLVWWYDTNLWGWQPICRLVGLT